MPRGERVWLEYCTKLTSFEVSYDEKMYASLFVHHFSLGMLTKSDYLYLRLGVGLDEDIISFEH